MAWAGAYPSARAKPITATRMRGAMGVTSVELHPDRLNDLGSRIGLRADKRGELFRRAAAGRFDPGSEQFFAHLWHRQYFSDRAVQLEHNLARRARGRDDALPDAEIVAWKRLGNGWNLRRERKALGADQAENFDLLVAPKWQRHVDALHAEGNVAGKNAGDLRGPAAIGHHAEMGAGHHVEQAHIDLRGWRADPDLESAWLRLLLLDQLAYRIDRNIDVADQRGRNERDQRNRRKILERIVGELAVEERIHDERAVDRH